MQILTKEKHPLFNKFGIRGTRYILHLCGSSKNYECQDQVENLQILGALLFEYLEELC